MTVIRIDITRLDGSFLDRVYVQAVNDKEGTHELSNRVMEAIDRVTLAKTHDIDPTP